jgi:hypothetical protein
MSHAEGLFAAFKREKEEEAAKARPRAALWTCDSALLLRGSEATLFPLFIYFPFYVDEGWMLRLYVGWNYFPAFQISEYRTLCCNLDIPSIQEYFLLTDSSIISITATYANS